jgi:hypothetical protein
MVRRKRKMGAVGWGIFWLRIKLPVVFVFYVAWRRMVAKNAKEPQRSQREQPGNSLKTNYVKSLSGTPQ